MRWVRRAGTGIALLLAVVGGLALIPVERVMGSDWRTASREPAGIAPDPATTPEALVQVYAARAWGWRGRFAVHSWIAVKPSNAPAFTVYEVIGWRAYHGMSPVAVHNRPADGRWFGAMPKLLFELRGDGVDDVIRRIDAASETYPHADTYRAWPGPNSNTFIAHIVRSVPELTVDLPPTAIGKNYLPNGSVFAKTPGGTGVQVSVFGLLGVMVGVEEGLEVNLFGLVFGIDPKDLALKLPVVGRLGAT